LIASDNFRGVGGFYEQFEQVEDDEVIRMLNVLSP
jgi:putative phosphoribosyl transferase